VARIFPAQAYQTATEEITVVLLDTDHMTILEWADSSPAQRLLARLDPLPEDQVGTSIISFEEQVGGWMAAAATAATVAKQVEIYRRLQRQLQHYCQTRILGFDEQAAIRFQAIRQQRIRIGTKDLQIAAIALAHGATVFTRNVSDFRKVPGLNVEDWTAEAISS
jgi:tRNA(fMet)-specific endonuclease VapC